MLSYQHAYHAGSRADIHKHDILARALEVLSKEKTQLTYIETHAGRGVYNLSSDKTEKTGEAAEGWLKLAHDKNLIAKLCPSYVEAVRALNSGKLLPRYPGSPMVAAHILRKHDKMKLMELHPNENTALRRNFTGDKRVEIQKRDGLQAALQMIPNGKGLALIDPSYEVKTDYDAVADFVIEFHAKWPQGVILLWAPMLPALRHEGMFKNIQTLIAGAQVSEVTWAKPGDVRGMYGSIIMGINAGPGFQTSFARYISDL